MYYINRRNLHLKMEGISTYLQYLTKQFNLTGKLRDNQYFYKTLISLIDSHYIFVYAILIDINLNE